MFSGEHNHQTHYDYLIAMIGRELSKAKRSPVEHTGHLLSFEEVERKALTQRFGVECVSLMYSNLGIAQVYPSGKSNDLLYIRQG
jgi:hypothetical protein